MMTYQVINKMKNKKLHLMADDLRVIEWYMDSSFMVHPDYKSHTGGIMTYGRGAPITMSRKQRLNTRSSIEAKLVGVNDVSTMILWTKLFLKVQGYGIRKNILAEDNKSTILLEKNGKKSSSQHTRAINIRYFFITDQVEQGNITIEYCPTGQMVADYMTKLLQGAIFKKFKN